MARPPTLKFRAEDLQENGQFSVERLVRALNTLGQSQQEALNHGITHAENLREQVVTLRVQTAAAVADTFPLPEPIRLADYMPARPTTVRVAERRRANGSTAAFDASSDVDWVSTGARQVSIRYITGLADSTEYLITLIVEG